MKMHISKEIVMCISKQKCPTDVERKKVIKSTIEDIGHFLNI